MRRRATLIALLLLAGCSTDTGASPTVTVTVTRTALPAPSEQATTSSASTSEPPDVALPMGSTVDFDPQPDVPIGTSVSVFEVRIPSPHEGDPARADLLQLVDADVQVCVTGDDSSVSTAPWSVADSDNRTYGASWYSAAGPPPYPPAIEYPIQDGECVRGWAMFETAVGSQILEIRYRGSGGARSAAWTVG